MSGLRIGQGIDAHRFSPDPARPLLLGGVVIPGSPGLDGHSDGDVVLHALTDAVLGAVGLGDIGEVFGIDDPSYAGAASRIFCEGACDRAAVAGWAVINADVTVVAARPRLAAHRAEMCAAVASILKTDAISIKATTTDGLGFAGRGEGIAAVAVVLLQHAPTL